MHHSVTGCCPSINKGHLSREKEKLLGESHFQPIHCKKEKEKKCGDNKCNKMAVYAVTRGMIRDHPDMLRLMSLYYVLTDFCMGRKETEGGWALCGEERKMLCWATKQKVSDSLFPHSERVAAVRTGSRRVTVLRLGGRRGGVDRQRALCPTFSSNLVQTDQYTTIHSSVLFEQFRGLNVTGRQELPTDRAHCKTKKLRCIKGCVSGEK